ncbi:hypothetical protein [uncultured Fibrobacter sp.]|uniref:hypothetical protein n=1 Tax=uncultured Fibrobacter sp. TaxID=261512 RepID=UPI0025E5CF31|nr:hypothetical protein [uncultured Fibrobacter sp.]
MARNIACILLMATWVVICSCSDDERPGIPYELKTACLIDDEPEDLVDSLSDNVLYKVAPQQTKSSALDDAIMVDTVYFRKNEESSTFVELKIPTYCGLDFSLHTKKIDDTLFVSTGYDSDGVPACSCISVVDFEIPDEMTSAKILYINDNRNFPSIIVNENGN